MEDAPYLKRYTLCSLAHVTGRSASTICTMRQCNGIMTTTNAIKPLMTKKKKRARIVFIVRFVDDLTLLYSAVYDVIHLDKKWFHMTRESQRIYRSPNEPSPVRYVRCLFNISNGCAVIIRVTYV